MSLSIETAVLGVADALRDKIAPTLTDSFATETARLSAMMLTIMAHAADDTVALRVEENAALRALLGDAAPLLADLPELSAAAASQDPGLRISELERETDRLRRLMVAAQVGLEALDGAAAKALDQRIWRHLLDVEEKRAPRL